MCVRRARTHAQVGVTTVFAGCNKVSRRVKVARAAAALVNSLHVGVCRGGGTCGAGACATVIVLSLNSCCHSYCVPVGRLLEYTGT